MKYSQKTCKRNYNCLKKKKKIYFKVLEFYLDTAFITSNMTTTHNDAIRQSAIIAHKPTQSQGIQLNIQKRKEINKCANYANE